MTEPTNTTQVAEPSQAEAPRPAGDGTGASEQESGTYALWAKGRWQRAHRWVRKALDSESRFFLKNSSWLLSANVVRAVAVFARSILIARSLGVAMFGLYVIITTFVAVVQEFFNMQTGSALIKFGAERRQEDDERGLVALIQCGYLIDLVMAAASVLTVWAVVTLSYDAFIEEPGLTPYVLIFAAGGAIVFLEHPCLAILRLFYRYKVNAAVTTVFVLIELGLVAGAVTIWPGQLGAVVLAMTISPILRVVAMNISLAWELKGEVRLVQRVPLREIGQAWRTIWRFVIGNSGSNTLKKLMYRGDVLLLAVLAGTTQVSYYAIGKKLATMLKVITDPLAYTIYPQIAALIAAQEYGALKRMIRNVTTGAVAVAAGGLVLLALAGEWVIDLAYGAEFAGAAMPLLILSIAIALDAVFFWSISLLNSLALVAVRFGIYAVSAVVGFSVAWLLTPSMGAVGMAIALVAVNAVVQAAFIYYGLRQIRREARKPAPVQLETQL